MPICLSFEPNDLCRCRNDCIAKETAARLSRRSFFMKCFGSTSLCYVHGGQSG